MSDPLSVSAAIVSITVPALHGARLLLDDLQKIANAPEAVGRLAGDVDSISASLSLLKDIEGAVWLSLGPAIHDQSTATIQSCVAACNTIRGDIQRWTKRSRGGKLSWLDRVHVGFFRDRQLKAHSDVLQTYKLSFNSIVGTATLYSSIRNSNMTDEIRDLITQHQTRIEAANDSTQTEVAVVQRTLTELQSQPATDPAADDEEDRDTSIGNLEELMNALRLSHTLLSELSSRSEPSKVLKSAEDRGTTNITFGNNKKGIQVAINHGSMTLNSGR